MLSRPDSSEYAPFYNNYISLVPDGSLTDFLANQVDHYWDSLNTVPETIAEAAPAPGKWSLKQALGHVCDTERIMAYRILRFARGDSQELRGFEQDDYVREAGSNARPLVELLDEFEDVRMATIDLLSSLSEDSEKRSGVANGNKVTVRALAYVIAGHAQHHLELLKNQLAK